MPCDTNAWHKLMAILEVMVADFVFGAEIVKMQHGDGGPNDLPMQCGE